MTNWKVLAAVLAVGMTTACVGEDPEPTDDRVTFTKEQARSANGKDDQVIDWCEWMGWYGDGICDDFCLQVDPDCGACSADADCADGEQCSEGVCEALPEPDPSAGDCGGVLGLTCGAEEFCNYLPEAQCGAWDQQGSCEPRPEACLQIYDPVCGCDGLNYSNACDANSAGTAVAFTGDCDGPAPSCTSNADCAQGEVCNAGVCEVAPPPGSCGGIAGLTCGRDEYCDYPADSYCGVADELGTCKPRPEACLHVYDPVCGCDGQTYSNGCEANSAGVAVAGEGSCN